MKNPRHTSVEQATHIATLIAASLRGPLTVDQQRELTEWAQRSPQNQEHLAQAYQAKALRRGLETYYAADGTSIWDRTQAKIEAATPLATQVGRVVPTVVRRNKSWARLRWAAAAVAAFLAIGTFLFLEKRDSRQETLDTRLAATDILPGGNRATLTLADGRVIDLSETQTGIIVGAEDIQYIDGSSILDDRQQTTDNRQVDGKGSLASNVSSLMSISTPKGGTYRITLPDGSKVWLNAASTLKYPSRFDDAERVVELTGEAYFEVVRSRDGSGTNQRISESANQPFRVLTKDQTIEVLGTEFNVAAYPEESEEATTLVTGAVRVKSQSSGQAGQLTPGQQGALRNGVFTTSEVDVANFTAWKDGRFSFDDKTFDEVMRELGRWYDLDIVYEGPIPDKSFYGGAYRNDRFSIVMRLLRSADIDYKLQDKKLIIKSTK